MKVNKKKERRLHLIKKIVTVTIGLSFAPCSYLLKL